MSPYLCLVRRIAYALTSISREGKHAPHVCAYRDTELAVGAYQPRQGSNGQVRELHGCLLITTEWLHNAAASMAS